MGKDNRKKSLHIKAPLSEIIRHYGVRRALFFLILAIIFSTLILVYNILLGNYIRHSIMSDSELTANSSAKEVEIYLSTATDLVNLTDYTTTQMLADNATYDDLKEYLTDQTIAAQNSILPSTSGIYAYLNGEFVDGSGWIPDEDYAPMERPWYTEAVTDRGNVVLINPYFDLFTEEVLMTIAKAHELGDDVIAIDVTLGEIQEIIEENTFMASGTERMVISNNGFVVAHSDPGERGKNYLEEKDTFGNLILEKLSGSDKRYTEFSHKGTTYVAYSVPIGNDWLSISVINAEAIYKPLVILFITSIIAIILTFFTFTMIMIRNGRRTLEADKYQSILSSAADIYMSLCDLDVINNTALGIKNVNPAIAKATSECGNKMKETLLGIMKGLPESPTKQAAIDFTDLSTIDERMKDTNTALVEYISYGNIWVRARLVVSERLPDGRVSHVLWMLENIDEEKKEREKLIDMSERAIAASEAKSSFLSNMSHEIRTPINAILGMNEMVLRESIDENVIAYSQNIRSAGGTLLGLVNDILDFSKIESGKMEIIPVDYDLSSVLNDLINMIRPRLDSKGLELILNIDQRIPQFLFGDDVRLRQVITNILTNAVKYTESGSVTLSMGYSRVDGDENNISLKISIKDTGIGIKKEDLNKLFSEFERIEEKRNRNIEGTGLGMSITKSLLALMGSSLNVDSVYGEGSTFSFEIIQRVREWSPLGDYEDAYRKSVRRQEKYRKRFTAPSARVLVVDDTPMNLIVFTSLLKSTEIKVDTASSGDEGIALALKNKYDMIFFDHMMPKKDGIETLKEFKAIRENINADTPVICLTANAIQGARELYLNAGFTNYLTKPIDPKNLEDMILEYLPFKKVIEVIESSDTDSKAPAWEEKPVEILPDFIFRIIDLNTVEGIRRCGGEKIYIKALSAFARSIGHTIDQTEKYRKINDAKNVLINIGSIKASAELIGADSISALAADIETTGLTDVYDSRIDDLFKECEHLSSHLAPLI